MRLKIVVFLLGFWLFNVCDGFAQHNPLIARHSITEPIGDLNKTMIWVTDSINTPYQHASFRRKFNLPKKPLKGSVRIFSYTRYQLFVNGVYVCRGPSRFENKRPEFDEIEVTQYLNTGDNCVAILVHRDSPTGRIMQHLPGLTAQLDIFSGSEHLNINTDKSWKSTCNRSYGDQRRTWSSISENIDATKFDPDWIMPYFDDSDWKNAQTIHTEDHQVWPLIHERSIPMLKETEIEPVAGLSNGKQLVKGDSLILNFSRIVQAYPKLTLNATAGTEFDVRFGLPGNSASGMNKYICKAGVQTYIGGDTYAFNTMKIYIKAGAVTFAKQQAVEVLYPFKQVGTFNCENTLLNKIWSISANTLKLLSEDAYVDCADRERVEWMDCDPPAFDCTRVMMSGPGSKRKPLWSDARLLKDMIRRVALTQREDGMMKAHTCSERWDKHAIMEDRACDWVNGLKKYYESTGDKKLVREVWPNLQRLLQWFTDHTTANGLVEARDWTTWDNPLIYQVCNGAALNAFVYSAYTDAAYLAQQIGNQAQFKKYTAAASDLARNYDRLLWDEKDGSYYGGYFNKHSDNPHVIENYWQPTLIAAVFALDKNIVRAERKKRVTGWVLKNLDQSHAPMSQYVIYKLLYDLGRDDLDSEVLAMMSKNWQPMTTSAWQTTWEDFNKGSKIHIYGILPAYYLSSYVLGVRINGPVFNKSITINPRLGDLKQANGTVVTEFGPVKVSWQRMISNCTKFHFTVPPDITANVSLPVSSKHALVVNGRTLKVKEGKPTIFKAGVYDGYTL